MRIAILGAGSVGGALGQGWSRAGHRIVYGVPNPKEPKHAAAARAAGGADVTAVGQAVGGAEAIVLAVPWPAVPDAIAACGNLAGRIVIDVTNPLRMGADGLELAPNLPRRGRLWVPAFQMAHSAFKQEHDDAPRSFSPASRCSHPQGGRKQKHTQGQAGTQPLPPGAGETSRHGRPLTTSRDITVSFTLPSLPITARVFLFACGSRGGS